MGCEAKNFLIDIPRASSAATVQAPAETEMEYDVANPVATQMIPVQDEDFTFSTVPGAMWGTRRIWNTDKPIPQNVKTVKTASKETEISYATGSKEIIAKQNNLLTTIQQTALQHKKLLLIGGAVLAAYLLLK